MEVMPVNSAERMYAIVVIFSGLVTRLEPEIAVKS
jgi:hypothetical protein